MNKLELIQSVSAHTEDSLLDNHMYMDFPFFGFGGVFFMLIFWVLMIWFFVFLFQKTKGDDRKSDKTALDILNERYAKGEIDKKEYEEKKKALQK